MSMEHGEDTEPHVFAAEQTSAGLEVERTSPLISLVVSLPIIEKKSGREHRQQRNAL